MQRSLDFAFEQPREFVAVGYRPCLFRQVLKDDAGVVRTSEEGAVNALGASLHRWGREPHQRDPKKSTHRHADIGTLHKKS